MTAVPIFIFMFVTCFICTWPANSLLLFVCIIFCTALLINISIYNILRSLARQHEVNFAASAELSFCCYYDFLTSERAIQEDLGINEQDLVKDKLFYLFQLINSMDKI